MTLGELGTTVENLSGVGPSTAKLFARMNIFTVADLLSTYPRDYEDRTRRIPLKDFESAKVHTVCKVTAHDWFGYGRMRTLKIAITDGTASAWLIAFNRPFLEKNLPEGSIISVTGRFEIKYNSLQSSSFEAERLSYEGELEDFADGVPNSGILPVYPLTEGLSQKNFRKTMSSAIQRYGKAIEDELPPEIIKERKLLSKSRAIIQIHSPETLEQAREARRTLIYEELYNFEYKMASRILEHRGTLPALEQTAVFEAASKTEAGESLPCAAPFFQTPEISAESFEKQLSPRQKEFLSRLPFPLTDGQMSAIAEMNRDIDRSQEECNFMLNKPERLERNPFSMQRLLQGDVGSGKTLVAFFLCLRTIDYGGQCAVMAPTELLARQHAENAAKMLEPLGVKVAFLTGNLKASGRQPLIAALKNGDVHIVIGTHALFSSSVQYKNLQLAVIDEQHRFGVTQRESIIAKGRISEGAMSHSPDVLMMSATPIPQTLALTVFGDLDISTIRTMPRGRKPVKTYLSVMGHETNAYEAVRKELEAGHQAYFVYPRISESTDQGTDAGLQFSDQALKSAEEMFSFLSEKIYPSFKCALIHSKIEEDEQNRILHDFRDNKIQILVATTVVEVGVDVPNATCIVIEHADRFGLAELHQLRGRVGRGDAQSFCFLIYGKNITEDGKQRMKALHESTDGFAIAEEDLRLRGPGQVTGTMQSGYLALGIADLARDKQLLIQARYDAFTQIRKNRSI
ncbi:MAG TPA: ATP-dependent DNA helicase RecG [Treponema sp.]|nr:ATP-dependent DNA helicase RecG [Treponema sp.]